MKKIKITNKQAELLGLNENNRRIVKITKEQYNRIFAEGLINESEVKGGTERVDKAFKIGFAGKDIDNLKEDEFNISAPNTAIPKLKSNVGDRKAPMDENTDGELKKETIELIKYLYRKSEEFSPFWDENGLTYDEICDMLLNKKLIISKNGKYEVAKGTSANPKEAIEKIENELRSMLQPKGEPEMETEASNYPAGAEADSNAPFNQNDDTTDAKVPEDVKLEVLASNNEIAILKDPSGELFVFYFGHLNKSDFTEYASLTRTYVGKDEDGPIYDYDEDFDITSDVISNYVNDNLDTISKGEGFSDYEDGKELVKIDEPLKQDLLSLYDKNKDIVNILAPLEEGDNYDELLNRFKLNMDAATTKAPSTETPEAKQSRIVAKLAELKAKEKQRQKDEEAEFEAMKKSADIEEMTSAASSGSFTGPLGGEVVDREMPDVPVVGETTTVASAGNFQYDAPGLANVGRNGEFKKGPKTQAQAKTQYAGGSFVKINNCTKLNNNKEAENGKCSQGAVDGVVKQSKTSSSVISPSLDENTIYKSIAETTGKSLDDIKQIIESKKDKA